MHFDWKRTLKYSLTIWNKLKATFKSLHARVGWWGYPVFAATSLVTFASIYRPIKSSVRAGETNPTKMEDELDIRKCEAFWGLFVGDAMAMPVHWYYNPSDIKRQYDGWITGYTAPNKRHPSSIMSLSAVDGSGRTGWGENSQPVIGNVILHDKLKYWSSGSRDVHYHQGMESGDNTLNAVTALQTMKTMQMYDSDATLDLKSLQAHVMENYVKFMTTPGSHNDTYAESFHRSFFKDWISLESPPKSGRDILDFCDKRWDNVVRGSEDGQLAVVGALVLSIPWILHYAHLTQKECTDRVQDSLKLTHPAPSLMPFIEIYSNSLHAVLNGRDLYEVAVETMADKNLGGSRKRKIILEYIDQAKQYSTKSEEQLDVYQDGVSSLGSACYIKGALSSLLLLATGFHNDAQNGIITNANCGGETAHRGAALSALLAANTINIGTTLPNHLKQGLRSQKSQIEEILKHKL